MAVAGNTLRAGAPPARGDLGLGALAIGDASVSFRADTLDADFNDVLRAREVLYRTYAPDADEPVWVFLGYFDRQREGSQVHSPRHCYPGSGWNIELEPVWTAPWGGELRSIVVNDGEERRLVCYWYQTADRVVTDVLPLKMLLARDAVMRRPQDVVFASISTPFTGDAADAMARLAPYATDVQAGISQLYRSRHESVPIGH